MATIKMDTVIKAHTDRNDVYEAKDDKTGAGNGEWVEIQPGVQEVAVDLVIISGSARVESTGESLSKVQDNSAAGVPWPAGDVSVRTKLLARGETAVRLVIVSGQAIMYVRGI